ncbi:MAG: cytochrome c [Steroidobacteraceae bacterium]
MVKRVWLLMGMLLAPGAYGADSSAPERRGHRTGLHGVQQHCTACHGNPAFERAPSPATLRSMSPERIYTALTTGIMKSVGDTLSRDRPTARRRITGRPVPGLGCGGRCRQDAQSLRRQSAVA